MTQSIKILDQTFVLHPSGTLFWEDEGIMMISDVHLGKVTHFRKYGAAVPAGLAQKNFELLDSVMTYFRPSRLCFLGDLFHSSINSEWKFFEDWISRYSTWVWLVSGNHDIISPIKFENLGIQSFEEIEVGKFFLTHEPARKEGLFNISGHIHPAVRLRGRGRQSLRLPCFFKTRDQLIVPAFGQFTGSHVLPVTENDEVYACTKSEVVKV